MQKLERVETAKIVAENEYSREVGYFNEDIDRDDLESDQ